MILKTKHKLAIARLVQMPVLGVRRLFGQSAKTTVVRNGLHWELDLQEGIDFTIYLMGQFERTTNRALARLLEPGDTVIDIGANIGAHTLPLADLVGPGGKVFAVEPTSFAYQKLCANVALNPQLASRIDAEQIMLTESSDAFLEKEIYSSWPLAGAAQGHAKHGGRAMSTDGAHCASLTDFVESRNLEKVRLLKLDVDGFEVDVLRGGEAFLKRQKPILVMELAPYTLEDRGKSLDALLQILNDVGYRLADEKTGKPLASDSTNLRALVPDGGSVNVIAAVPS